MSEKINSYVSLLKEISGIAKAYGKFRKGHEVQGFNVFLAISDIYYRENFHSDFMAMLLDPSSPHHEGELFLQGFIEMINLALKEKESSMEINKDWYGPYTQVFREKGKIDILIKGSKHLVIVENKINNAVDMDRQLPKYVDYVKGKYSDCTLDAIVYLPLDENKEPDRSTWHPGDEELVNDKLVIIPAYTTNGKINIVGNWLTQCYESCNDPNTKPVLNQYIELVKILKDNMDTDDINKLAREFEDNPDYVSTYRSLSEMWEELCQQKQTELVERINKGIKHWGNLNKLEPTDKKYWKLGLIPVVIDGKTNEYGIAVGTFINKACTDKSRFYNVQFWNDTNYYKDKGKNIREELAGSQFSISDETIMKASNFDENGLLKCEIAWYFHLGEEDKIVSLIQELIDGCSIK